MQAQFSLKLTRSSWLTAHLYLALSVGFLFALIGLSGSLSIYRAELDTLLNPQLTLSAPPSQPLPLDRIIAAVRNAHPQRYGAWTLEMPDSPEGMITAWYEKPTETFFELYAPLMVSVNPYTGEVVSSRFWGQTAMTWLMDLHTQLRLDRLGWQTVGVLGIGLIISCVTGLYLWWPGLSGLKYAFSLRHTAGMMRLALDVHRLLGLLSLPALLVLASTGFLLSYPAVLEAVAGSSGMEHGQTGRTIASTAIPNNHPTGLAAAVSVAHAPFPRAQLRRVTTPVGDNGIYRINFKQASEINQRHPYTTVWVDRWSGQIKQVRDPKQFSKGETFATWIWPLHTGEALGAAGRFAWFLAGQSVFVLYISGLLRWLCRKRLVSDREVNFSGLKVSLLRTREQLYRTAMSMFKLMVLFWQLALTYKPHLITGCKLGQQWLRVMYLRAIHWRQKKLGHDND